MTNMTRAQKNIPALSHWAPSIRGRPGWLEPILDFTEGHHTFNSMVTRADLDIKIDVWREF